MYDILPYSKKQAKKLGVTIKPSTNKNKKIDIFKNNKKITSIGAAGYSDYPHFLMQDGVITANKHRKAYKSRHEKDRHIIGTAGFYADQILW